MSQQTNVPVMARCGSWWRHPCLPARWHLPAWWQSKWRPGPAHRFETGTPRWKDRLEVRDTEKSEHTNSEFALNTSRSVRGPISCAQVRASVQPSDMGPLRSTAFLTEKTQAQQNVPLFTLIVLSGGKPNAPWAPGMHVLQWCRLVPNQREAVLGLRGTRGPFQRRIVVDLWNNPEKDRVPLGAEKCLLHSVEKC